MYILEFLVKWPEARLEQVSPKPLNPLVVYRLTGNETGSFTFSRCHHIIRHAHIFSAMIHTKSESAKYKGVIKCVLMNSPDEQR